MTSMPHRAAWLCTATVAWNLLVGGAAVLTAAATGNLSLIGFGVKRRCRLIGVRAPHMALSGRGG